MNLYLNFRSSSRARGDKQRAPVRRVSSFRLLPGQDGGRVTSDHDLACCLPRDFLPHAGVPQPHGVPDAIGLLAAQHNCGSGNMNCLPTHKKIAALIITLDLYLVYNIFSYFKSRWFTNIINRGRQKSINLSRHDILKPTLFASMNQKVIIADNLKKNVV